MGRVSDHLWHWLGELLANGSYTTIILRREESREANTIVLHHQSMIAIQAAVTADQLPSAMAFLVFAQSMGPAIVLALCNVVFDASLRSELQKRLSNTDAEAVISAGASAFRSILAPGQLGDVLKAYSDSIDRTFYVVAASAAMGSIALWGMGWKDLRKKEDKNDQEEESTRKEGTE